MKISDKIEKDIPIKSNLHRSQYYEESIKFINMLNKLKVKDSFVVQLETDVKKELSRLRGWLVSYRKLNKDVKVKSRSLDEGVVRVWRTQ